MRPIKKGSTDQSVVLRIVDSGDGTPETGVEHNSSGIDLWYRREGAAKTSITEAALSALTDAHSDGGIEHIGDGYYRLDLPDAAFATGSNGVMIGGTVTGMVVIGCYVHLTDYDPQDGVRLGLTALPPAAADAAGGLIISDAGGLDADAQLVTKINDILTDTGTTLQGELDGIQTDTEDIQSRLPATLTADGNIKADTLRWGGTLVDSANVLIDGAITAAKIASDAITSAKVADGFLTAAKFASGAFDAVWSVATRLLTAGTNIVLAKGTGVTGFNDLSAAQVNAEADQALADYDGPTYAELRRFITILCRSDAATATDLFSLISEINADNGSGAGDFANTTEALEAIRDRGDSAWTTATGFSTLDAAGVRSAVGLASADLDIQLDALPTNSELATALASADDAVLAAIAALNNLSQANVRTALGLASANLDIQLDALPTAAENAAAILAAGDVDGYSLEETLKLCLAALAGKLSGAATTAIVIRAADDSKARITATVDADGNRSAVTLDETG